MKQKIHLGLNMLPISFGVYVLLENKSVQETFQRGAMLCTLMQLHGVKSIYSPVSWVKHVRKLGKRYGKGAELCWMDGWLAYTHLQFLLLSDEQMSNVFHKKISLSI